MLVLFLAWCLFALAWLMPGHYLPWPSFQNQAVACLALVLMLVVAWCRVGGLRLGVLGRAFALLIPVPLLQGAFGRVPFIADAVVPSTLIAVLTMAVVVGGALHSTRSDGFRVALFSSLVVAAAASVVLQWMQWLGYGGLGVFMVEQLPTARPFGNLAQPNHLGTLLCLGLGGLAYLRLTARLKGVVWIALVVWLLTGLVMTQSRTAWLQVGLLAVFAAGLHRRRSDWRVWGLYLLGYGCFLTCSLAWIPLNDALLLTPPKVGLSERLHVGSRWEYWPVLARAVWQHPWMGWGWNQVGAAQQFMGSIGPAGYELLGSAHNIVLDLALQAGIPVAAVIVWLTVRWFWQHAALDGRGVLVVCVGVILLHAMTEFPLDGAHFLITVGLLIGAATPQGSVVPDAAVDSQPTAGWRRQAFAVAGLALTMSLGWIGMEYLQMEQADRDARMVQARIGAPPGASIPPPEVLLLDGLREFHRFRFTEARPGMPQHQMEWMRTVVRRYPFPPAALRLAMAEGLNGEPDRAQAALRALCHANVPPRCQEGRQAWDVARQQYAELPPFPMVVDAPAWWKSRTLP